MGVSWICRSDIRQRFSKIASAFADKIRESLGPSGQKEGEKGDENDYEQSRGYPLSKSPSPPSSFEPPSNVTD
jgi:hypothetical protein